MSVGSDPIECCVRGRFLCVCVTARRRGFRGGRGPFASGLRETSFDLFWAPSRYRFRGGGGSARASSSRALRISVRGSCRFFAARPSSDHGRWPDFVRSAPRQGGRAAGGTASSLYASAAGVLAGGFLVPAGFGRKCGSHSTGRKRAACCGPFGPGRCLRRDPRPKRTDRLSRYGRDNVGRARGSGCRKTCRGAVRTLPASRCGR